MWYCRVRLWNPCFLSNCEVFFFKEFPGLRFIKLRLKSELNIVLNLCFFCTLYKKSDNLFKICLFQMVKIGLDGRFGLYNKKAPKQVRFYKWCRQQESDLRPRHYQ